MIEKIKSAYNRITERKNLDIYRWQINSCTLSIIPEIENGNSERVMQLMEKINTYNKDYQRLYRNIFGKEDEKLTREIDFSEIGIRYRCKFINNIQFNILKAQFQQKYKISFEEMSARQ